MISFKQFILEKSGDDGPPSYKPLNMQELLEVLQTECSNAKWMFTDNTPLWRGDASLSIKELPGFTAGIIAEPKSRVSQNTGNYYTLIFDNIKSRIDVPKRGKSFIASTDSTTAHGFGEVFFNLYAVIPFNSTKIGVVPHSDMWSSNITMFGKTLRIKTWNTAFQKIGLPDDNWSEWEQFDEDLKNQNQTALAQLEKSSLIDVSYASTFLEQITDAYSVEKTDQSVHTTETLSHIEDCEVWIGGKCIFIPRSVWSEIRKTINGKSK